MLLKLNKHNIREITQESPKQSNLDDMSLTFILIIII